MATALIWWPIGRLLESGRIPAMFASLESSVDWAYVRAVVDATAMWTCGFLAAAALWNVWRLYGLMGVHLKAPPAKQAGGRPAATVGRPAMKRKPG